MEMVLEGEWTNPRRTFRSLRHAGASPSSSRRAQTPLLIAVSAFLFGCLVTAGLTSTADAQSQAGSRLPRYVPATTDAQLAASSAEGHGVKLASHTPNYVE